MTIKQKITQLFSYRPELTVKEIVEELMSSKQMVHIALKALMEEGLIEKFGRAPKTIYKVKSKVAITKDDFTIDQATLQVLSDDFLMITESGDLKSGIDAFKIWCSQRKLPIEKTAREFQLTLAKYKAYFDDYGFINGMEKLRGTKGYERINLDQLYYLDFYAIERFGKTKLGTLLHYAKQGQSKFLMIKLVEVIGDKVRKLCEQINVDGVVFVPPTIRREVQLMKFLEAHLHLPYTTVNVKKISGIIPIPQKSLNKIEERISNAQNTFAVLDTRSFNHILLIDDAVGSGATVNEIAGKIKQKGVAQQVSALAITGSFKGFDVITDV